jgi:hypothetical protein
VKKSDNSERWFGWAIVLMAILCGTLTCIPVIMMFSHKGVVIGNNNIAIYDPKGNLRIKLEATDNCATITLIDAKGMPRVVMSQYSACIAKLGGCASAIALTDDHGVPRFFVGVDNDLQDPYLIMNDHKRRPLLSIFLNESGEPVIVLKGTRSENRISIGTMNMSHNPIISIENEHYWAAMYMMNGFPRMALSGTGYDDANWIRLGLTNTGEPFVHQHRRGQ